MNRRDSLKTMVAAAILPYLSTACATVSTGEPLDPAPSGERDEADNATALFPEAALPFPAPSTAIRIIQSPNPEALLAEIQAPGYPERLTQATYSFVAAAYGSGNLPLWKRPLSQIDLLFRIRLAAEAMVPAVLAQAQVYPVDPAWLMGQILAESFFFEFAISSSLAVGMCQFIRTTAKEYGMICADAPRRVDGLREIQWQGEAVRAETMRAEARQHRRAHPELFARPERALRELTALVLSGGDATGKAKTWTDLWKRQEQLQSEAATATRNFRAYLEANFEGRVLGNPEDDAFLADFDQRTLPRFAVPAMVRMMARHLRARGGNILAATAGYNAGLGTTDTDAAIYARYGRLPVIEETVTYVSRIVVHHHEIRTRLAG